MVKSGSHPTCFGSTWKLLDVPLKPYISYLFAVYLHNFILFLFRRLSLSYQCSVAILSILERASLLLSACFTLSCQFIRNTLAKTMQCNKKSISKGSCKYNQLRGLQERIQDNALWRAKTFPTKCERLIITPPSIPGVGVPMSKALNFWLQHTGLQPVHVSVK